METNFSKTIILFTLDSWDTPLVTHRIVGPAQHTGTTIIRGNDGESIFTEKVSEADLVVIQRDFPRYGKAYDEILKISNLEGKPVIFDIDDLLLELPEDHPDRLTHYYSDALLPMVRGIIEASGVTVSTQMLGDYVRTFNPNVWLLPNYLNDRIWVFRSPKSSSAERDPVVIGYMGGDSHIPDLQYVAPVLLKISRRLGEKVQFRFLGARPPSSLSDQPNIIWAPSKTFDYTQFVADFLDQDYDIFIAPLRDNLFNRCKSAIKFLEYSASGVPGVYSRISPYSSIVNHGENGFLASTMEEWEEYLLGLIERPKLREEIATKAQETVRADWLLSQNAKRWVEVYSQASVLKRTPPDARPPEIITLWRIAKQMQEVQPAVSDILRENQALKQEMQKLSQQLEQAEMERDSLGWQLRSRVSSFIYSWTRSIIQQLRRFRSRITRSAD